MANRSSYQTTSNGHVHRAWEDLAVAEDREGWVARSRVMLTPIAAPSIMGLFGFAIATVMLGAYQAGWYGSAVTPLVIWPLALFAGGVMQGSPRSPACAPATASRSPCTPRGPASGSAGASSSCWWPPTSWPRSPRRGEPVVRHVVRRPRARHLLGRARRPRAEPAGLRHPRGAHRRQRCHRGRLLAGSLGTVNAGGWLFVVSAAAAWLAGGAMVLEHSFGRSIIPVGKWSKTANMPGAKVTDPIAYQAGMPGVRVGQ